MDAARARPSGPRYERRLWVTAEGLVAAVALAAGERVPGRPLGPRQKAALAELASLEPVPAGRRAGRRRSPSATARRPSPAWCAAASCARRCASVRAGPSPAAPRRPAARARRASSLTPDQAAAPAAGPGRAGGRRPDPDPARRGHRRRQDRDLRRGDRGVAGCRPAGAPARARDRAGDAHRGPAAGGPRGQGRRPALGPGRGGARRRVAPDPRRARPTSSSGRGRPSWRRWRTSG